MPTNPKVKPCGRKPRVTCTVQRCHRSPTAGTKCLTHAKKAADAAWAAKVRKDVCELRDILIRCSGPIQACHGFSRGYLGTRYLIENGFSGCAAHNLFAELKPLEWDNWLRAKWGAEKYEALRNIALGFKGLVDYEAIVKALS